MWLIGSNAAQKHLRLSRRPADIDLIATKEELGELLAIADASKESTNYPGKWQLRVGKQAVEVDATDNVSRRSLSDFGDTGVACLAFRDDIQIGDKSFTVCVPKLTTLWCFKRSHAGYPIFPEKTLADLILLSRAVIGTEVKDTVYADFLHPLEIELLSALRGEVKERFARRDRRMTFNRDAKTFFKSAQNMRTYEHDSLHDATYRWDAPLYRDNLVDPVKALVDMDLFMSRPLEYRLTMAQEEAVVIGLERFYLNNPDLSSDAVYRKGMTKLIFDLCKGRFQDFVLDHIHLMTSPLWDYMSKFREAETAGRLQIIGNDETNIERL